MTYEMTLLENRMAGFAEGRAEGIENTSIKMLNKGVSFETIQEFTDLSISRIKELAKKFEKEGD